VNLVELATLHKRSYLALKTVELASNCFDIAAFERRLGGVNVDAEAGKRSAQILQQVNPGRDASRPPDPSSNASPTGRARNTSHIRDWPIHVALDQHPVAARSLQRAQRDGDWDLAFARGDARWEPVRGTLVAL
jgi:hypothetical protein